MAGVRSFLIRSLIILVFLACGSAVSVAIGEVFIRIAFPERVLVGREHGLFTQYDAELGWFNTPNAEGVFRRQDFAVHVHQNRFGMRSDEEPSLQHGAKKRLLLLGDSFTWGFGVEAQWSFAGILKSSLSETEILNFGVSGYGQDQELLLLRREGPRWHPDTVMVLIDLQSDLENNQRSIQYQYQKPVFLLENDNLSLRNVPVPRDSKLRQFGKWLSVHSAIANLTTQIPLSRGFTLFEFLEGFAKRITGVKESPVIETNRPVEEITCALLQALAAETAAIHSRIVFALAPRIDISTQKFVALPGMPETQLRTCAAMHALPLLDLSNALNQGTPQAPLTFAHDFHWNEAGHALVAKELIAAL